MTRLYDHAKRLQADEVPCGRSRIVEALSRGTYADWLACGVVAAGVVMLVLAWGVFA